ncbi:MAG: hypothetical protein IH861_16440 [Chloroflexi bacterium]|nr:hypothetical protein [Chloroflexota bacterium]
MNYTRKDILGRWLHSHEEDSATEMVFRPSTFPFPPSRGRVGFELRANGSYVDRGIGPGDGLLEAEGEWSVENGILTLACHIYPGGRRDLRIISCDTDRLVIEK